MKKVHIYILRIQKSKKKYMSPYKIKWICYFFNKQ